MKGVKHLIQCHCILPQYRKMEDPVFHKFVVFSILNEEDEVQPKFAECNNCGVTHKVYDICKSEIVHNAEGLSAIANKVDIGMGLPKNISSILETYKCDISIWENIKFLYDNEIWNESVVMTKDEVGGSTQIKSITLFPENKVRVDTHLRDDDIFGDYSLK